MPPIIVTMTSIDRAYVRRSFKTLDGAKRFAQRYVGPTPTLSQAFQYAVSDDGINKITASIPIADLFPASADARSETE